MRILFNNLNERFTELAEQAEKIEVAVAWTTIGSPVDALLQFASRRGSKALRLVTGIQGNATHPDALDKLHRQATLKIAERNSGRLFHPKLYVFHLPGTAVTWIGSANLTHNAFWRNSECVSELEGPLHPDVRSYFDLIWNGAEASTEDFLEEYRSSWSPISQLPEYFPASSILTEDPSTWLDLTPIDWPRYMQLIRTADQYWANRWSSLEEKWGVYSTNLSWKHAIEDFQRVLGDSWETLDKEAQAVILGTRGYNALFGAMTGHGMLRSFFGAIDAESRKAREQMRSLLVDLRNLPSTGPDFLRLVAKTYDALKETAPVDVNMASASITRFLALSRPDALVSVNKGCVKVLSRWTGIPQSRLQTRDGYVELTKWVMGQHWWDSPRPTNALENEIWSNRAAFLDAFAWNGVGVSYSYEATAPNRPRPTMG